MNAIRTCYELFPKRRQSQQPLRFVRRRLRASLALVGSNFLGNARVKSGWRLPPRS